MVVPLLSLKLSSNGGGLFVNLCLSRSLPIPHNIICNVSLYNVMLLSMHDQCYGLSFNEIP